MKALRERRAVLKGLLGGGVGFLMPAWGCAGGDGSTPTVVPASAATCGEGPNAWVGLDIVDYPDLDRVGGWVPFQDPSLLLDVNVAQVEEGSYVAVWRICPHGACYVVYEPDARSFMCPCHGSRFGEDGQLLEGPAERGLRTWPACRSHDTVFINLDDASRELP